VFLGALGLALTGSLSAAPQLAVPAAAAAGPWPAYLGNNRHSGLSAATGPRLFALAWYTNTGDDVDSSAVIANDGSVYISSQNGTLQARKADGGEKWTHTQVARVYASPVLGLDGEVLIGDLRGVFRAFNPDNGTVRWTVQGLGSVRGTAVVGNDGTVYVGTEAGQLIALDSRNAGKEKFRVTARGGVVTAPAIAPTGDVYWAANDGQLRRMSASGNVIWSLAFDGPIQASPSIGPDGTVYVGAGSSILALAGDSGAVLWRFGTGAPVATTPVQGPDGTVYAGADNGKFFAVAPGGTERWEHQSGAPIKGSAGVGADGTVYVGSGDSSIYAFNGATGQLLSSYQALDSVYGSISIGGDGKVFAGSRDNRLYALRDDVRTFNTSPSATTGDRIGGDVVRDPADGRVFVIVDGQRRFIPDPQTQLVLGLTTPVPRNLNASELVRYPEGPPLPSLKDGTVLRASNGPLYVIQGAKREWVRSLDDFTARGLRWEDVQAVDDRVLRSVTLDVQDGMLLKGPGERVYLITGGQRSWLTTPQALARYGDWSQVHYVSDAQLGAYAEGPQIT
jgi:outer membrane protein assembly factor BamB